MQIELSANEIAHNRAAAVWGPVMVRKQPEFGNPLVYFREITLHYRETSWVFHLFTMNLADHYQLNLKCCKQVDIPEGASWVWYIWRWMDSTWPDCWVVVHLNTCSGNALHCGSADMETCGLLQSITSAITTRSLLLWRPGHDRAARHSRSDMESVGF